MINRIRLPFLFLAAASLIFGLWTGLNRIGWNLHMSGASMHHGAIMVGGFLGTLISLEKIIPLKRKFLFAVPTMSGASLLFFFSGEPVVAWLFLLSASVGLSAVFLYYFRHERNAIYLLMLAGGVCWLIGNIVLISDNFYPLAFPWWLGFVLFIITSERLELMKFLPVSRAAKASLIALLALYVAGLAMSFHGNGSVVSGTALAGISVWLMRFDIVAISIKKNGLTRFVAIALLCGYVSMLMTGLLTIVLDHQPMGYDAVVHLFFLGFVFSMIFAHGPIILPGVLGVSAKPYHKLLYLWLILLHASWLIRVSSDLSLEFAIRQYSGIVSAIAILGYFATIATLTVKNLHRHAKLL